VAPDAIPVSVVIRLLRLLLTALCLCPRYVFYKLLSSMSSCAVFIVVITAVLACSACVEWLIHCGVHVKVVDTAVLACSACVEWLIHCGVHVKVVEVKQERWRNVILAAAPVFKCVCSSSVPASFSKCSLSVQNVKARESVSTQRIGVKSVRGAKSSAIAKCLKFTLTKVQMTEHFCHFDYTVSSAS